MKPPIYEKVVRALPDQVIVNILIAFYLDLYHNIFDRIKVLRARTSSNYQRSYTKSPKVLVYIPSYNRLDYLVERSIPSILRQTYTNYKICVIDDGSDDNTKQELKNRYGDSILVVSNDRIHYRYPNVSIYHWFAGPVDAANLALQQCGNGFDWIARIDDDDEWLPDHLEKAIHHVLNTNAEFYSSDYIVLNKDGTFQKRVSKDPTTGIGGTQTWVYHASFASMRYNMNCWRKRINRVNDTDLQYRFFRSGLNICHLNHDGCQIRPRNDEMVIGSKAYQQSPEKYENFYKSND